MAFAGGTAFAQSPTSDAYGGEAGSVAGLEQGGGGGDTPTGGGGGNEPTTTSGDGDLPFTGFQIGLALALGAGLVGTGVAMRRGVRPQQG